MPMNGFVGGFYKVSEIIMRLAYVNFLWIIFTLLGLVVFGFFPASTALLTVCRKWIIGEMDLPVFQTFFTAYKKEFMKSNVIGIVFLLIGYIIYIDLSIIREAHGLIRVIYFPVLLIFIGYLLTGFYLFPIIVHYDTKIFQAIRNSFMMMMMYPLSTIMMVFGTMAIYFLMTTIPGLIPLFAGSAFAFVIMWSALLAFSKIEKRQSEDFQQNENSTT